MARRASEGPADRLGVETSDGAGESDVVLAAVVAGVAVAVGNTEDLGIELVQHRIDEDKELLVCQSELDLPAEILEYVLPPRGRKRIGQERDPRLAGMKTAVGMLIEKTLSEAVDDNQRHPFVGHPAREQQLGGMLKLLQKGEILGRVLVDRADRRKRWTHRFRVARVMALSVCRDCVERATTGLRNCAANR